MTITLHKVARRMFEATYGGLAGKMDPTRKNELIINQAAAVSALAEVLGVDVKDILALKAERKQRR